MGAELLGTVVVGSVTVGAVVTASQYALFVYGLYASYRTKEKARRAYRSSMEDRTVSFDATAPARTIVYGENVVDGRVAYRVEPRDEPEFVDGIWRPANDKFYLVLALTPNHEIESFVDILFDGQPVGPWNGDLNNSINGIFVSTNSKFYKNSQDTVATISGQIPVGGLILAPSIVSAQTIAVSSTAEVPSNVTVGDVPANTVQDPLPPPPYQVIPGIGIQLLDENGAASGALGNHGFVLHYVYNSSGPLVRAWCYHGTASQLANPVVMRMSGGEWNSRCRLRGIPYIVLEMRGDVDKLGVMPQVSVIIRGKKCQIAGTAGNSQAEQAIYSQLSADAAYDYLRTEYPLRYEEFNIPLAVAARGHCFETIPAPVYGSFQTPTLFEHRYLCNVVLSTENSRNENLQLILASMSGMAVWSAGQMDIRAGVAQAAAKSFDDSDIVGNSIKCTPETPIQQSMNSVRGRFMERREIVESEKDRDGVYKTRTRIAFTPTDFPAYKSTAYILEDNGEEDWMEIDLPSVTSPYQAQRIALIQLRQSRNALSFEVTCGPSAAKASAGEVCYWNIESYGFVDKPFFLVKREPQPDGTYRCWWTESTPAIFEPTYVELAFIDPSPNTRLTPANVVGQVLGLEILTGPEYADFGQDGALAAYALVRWQYTNNPGVAYGGRIDVQYKFGESMDWTVLPPLPGDATEAKIPITRNRQIVVQVRQMNGAQVMGPWVTLSHYANNVPTRTLQGNLLDDAAFTYGGADFDEFGLHAWAHITDGPAVDYFGPDQGLSPNDDSTTFARHASTILASKDAVTDWQVEVRPNRVFIEDGTRFIAFADVHVEGGGFAYMTILFMDANDISLGGELRTEVFEALTSTVTHADFKTITVFADVPDGAVYLILQIGMTRYGVGGTADAKLRVRRPYCGYASAGQISRPNWTR